MSSKKTHSLKVLDFNNFHVVLKGLEKILAIVRSKSRVYSVHPTFTPESEYRYIAVRWTQYVLFKAPLPPLSKGGWRGVWGEGSTIHR
jgi:hypothetical protein